MGGYYSQRDASNFLPTKKSLDDMIGLVEGGMVLTLAFIFCSMLRTQNDLVFSYAPVKDRLHNLQIISLSLFPPLKGRELVSAYLSSLFAVVPAGLVVRGLLTEQSEPEQIQSASCWEVRARI